MGNLIEYINWRGDLSFNKDGFNKLDALAFSQLTLINFSNVIPKGYETITLEDAFNKYIAMGHKVSDALGLVISNKVHYLLAAMAQAERYKHIELFNYKYVFKPDVPIQFSAFTAKLGKDTYLISYGGTDDSIAGWLEDLSLMYEETLDGQLVAKKYYEKVVSETGGNYYLVGHSKGANLAMYTALACNDLAFSALKKTYNFDGPGFPMEQIFKTKNVKDRWRRITEYMPERGTIGRLFYHAEKYHLVKCDADVVYQHDVFNWQIMASDFLYAEKFGDEAIFLDHYFKDIVNNMTMDDRHLLINSLTKTASIMKVKTLTELRKNFSRFVGALFKLEKEERSIVNRIFLKKFINNPNISKMMFNVIFRKRTFKLKDSERQNLKIESQIDEDDLLLPDDFTSD